MGFFSDLGKGIGSIVKAPFEGAAALIQGAGNAVGSILHGPQGAAGMSGPGYLQGRCDQFQMDQMGGMGMNPMSMMMNMQMLQLQQALQLNMMLNAGAYPGGCCCR